MIEATAIVQARMSSSRLPGKVLRKIGDQSVLGHLLGRLNRSEHLAGVIVATTDSESDDPVAHEVERLGVACYRGNEDDVLDRFYQAASAHQLEYVVRITADCPLYDPVVLDRCIAKLAALNERQRSVDYLTNCTLKRTYPRGLDTEIFPFETLESAWKEAGEQYEREHVTPFIYRRPERFRLYSVENDEDLSRYRLTLDTPGDLELIQILIEELSGDSGIFTTAEVVKFLDERPELLNLNAGVEQRHGDNRF